MVTGGATEITHFDNLIGINLKVTYVSATITAAFFVIQVTDIYCESTCFQIRNCSNTIQV